MQVEIQVEVLQMLAGLGAALSLPHGDLKLAPGMLRFGGRTLGQAGLARWRLSWLPWCGGARTGELGEGVLEHPPPPPPPQTPRS